MKYSAAILLFAAAVFWSSASARPHNPEQQDVIDAFTRWAIAEMKELPEPHKTNLINKLHEAQHKHWDNLMEYMVHVQSMLVKYVQESGLELSRRKRDTDSNELVDSDEELLNGKIVYGLFARILISVAPPSHQSALEEKLTKALEEDYESFDDFEVAAIKIFEEETGLDYEKLKAEYEADEGKRSELGNKFLTGSGNAFKSALEEDSSSEED